MAFRGWFTLNGVEIANSSRVVAHIGAEIPTRDIGLMTADTDCSLTPIEPGRLLFNTTAGQAPIAPGRLLLTPPDGSRRYGPGLTVVGDCWVPDTLCFACSTKIGYDDSWPGLRDQLGDTIYRPELAPWYTTRVPESAEFAGIWIMDVKGLDALPGARDVQEMSGSGGAAGPYRDSTRKITFDALMLACSNAGLEYGMQWLACQLRDTNNRTDSVLRFFAAHPGESATDPATLLRELHGVVMTQQVSVSDAVNAGGTQNQQATMYRVTFELTALRPYAYMPTVNVPVEWDTVQMEPVSWVHAADCTEPEVCVDMPVLFGEGCEPEAIEVVSSPPPSCGGCLPVCAVMTHTFQVPVFDYPMRCHQTAVTLTVTNNGVRPLTLQGYWRYCETLDACEDELFPVQINGLPAAAELTLDGIAGRYWAFHAGRKRRPVGIVGTPTGAPWRPPIIDRSRCWEFVVVTDQNADFDIAMSLADREA